MLVINSVNISVEFSIEQNFSKNERLRFNILRKQLEIDKILAKFLFIFPKLKVFWKIFFMIISHIRNFSEIRKKNP